MHISVNNISLDVEEDWSVRQLIEFLERKFRISIKAICNSTTGKTYEINDKALYLNKEGRTKFAVLTLSGFADSKVQVVPANFMPTKEEFISNAPSSLFYPQKIDPQFFDSLFGHGEHRKYRGS